jgi:hypothetical protein
VLKGAGLDLHDFWTLGWAAQDDIMAAVAAMMAEKDADLLVAMAFKDAAFFTNDAVFADIAVHGQRRTCGIDSSEFRDWLPARALQENENHRIRRRRKTGDPSADRPREIRGRHPAPHVYIRFAEHGGRL